MERVWACVVVCVVCVGSVGREWGVWGRELGVWGREWGVRSVGERKYRSPLYYPDTLVNLDTCLGNEHDIAA